ncbi:GNAT family N-acetyltransferase [Deinococcus arcticus]|uniref:GNAT family N-acetyltransferase n=1 Tax=Deinococcus arcticus TaxID=2136176 RepID=A0A2T3W754_9DEIO|nr:GNAT family N-acetyltransferase [Deinococcus arcticus]PTA67725.1 GNAT family N-acetyltransferase [Deinococcus arcticus]
MRAFAIREATDTDLPALAELLSAVNPRHPWTAQTLKHELQALRDSPLGLHVAQWVAQDAVSGALLGAASALQFGGMYHPDRYHAELGVHPASRGQGVGTALAAELDTHLRARRAREILAGSYEDEPQGVAFLQARGFAEVMRFFDNVLTVADVDPAAWADQAALPPGLRVLSLAELRAEVGETAANLAFYEGWREAREDVPRTGAATPIPFETFRDRLIRPEFFPEGVLLAVTPEGEVAALSELYLDLHDPARLNTGLTGTRRAWRRHGLALALKLAALRLARERGAAEVWTGNATTNAPMLALNGRLGFRPRVAWIEMKWGGV